MYLNLSKTKFFKIHCLLSFKLKIVIYILNETLFDQNKTYLSSVYCIDCLKKVLIVS